MNIYVGNLSFELAEEDLRQAFEEFGEVSSAKLITDKFSGKPRGFGFVEMPDDVQGNAAIAGLDGKDLKGREIRVSMARPRENSDGGSYRG